MRIKTITDKFANLENRRGAYMVSEWDRETKTQRLTYRLDGRPIAEIYEYVNDKNYRLRVHPYSGYTGRMAHNNRVHALLWSVQMPDMKADNRWDLFRYSTYIRYSLKLYDRKLQAEYELGKGAMEFIYCDGRLTLDYHHLESLASPDKPTPTPTLDENSNLTTVNEQLNAIMAGV